MVTISPVGLATAALVANQVSLLATYKEKLCNSGCSQTVKPQYSISYTYGTPVLNETTVFVPVTAIITIVTSDCCGCGKTRIFNERFTAAFQGQTAVPTSVTITSEGRQTNDENGCCRSGTYTINDSLTILIA
ncbi:MAG: hypothetical protein E7077_06270 [Bacteroidales bacterium]|jgi:hypothetical protein|nr:hypothetical protein [Bacteroidales bacterium]